MKSDNKGALILAFYGAFCVLWCETLLAARAQAEIGVVSASLATDSVTIREKDAAASERAQKNTESSACHRDQLALAITPETPQPTPAHTTLVYHVTVTNHDVGLCADRLVIFQPNPSPPGFSIFSDPTNVTIGPGDKLRFTVSVTAAAEVDPGAYALSFRAVELPSGKAVSGSVKYVQAAKNGCSVRPSRELMITDPSVTDDLLRTNAATGGDPRSGSWSFGNLVERIAPTRALAPAMVERFFQVWLSDQVVNGFTIAARPGIRALILDAWPRSANGAFDLSRAPFRLLAIANRMDLRSVPGKGSAGEGRFIFGILDRRGNSVPFTLILEYRLPAITPSDVLAWGKAWHRLGALPFPSEEYNAALQALTERFTGQATFKPVLNAIRTNEAALNAIWELREFRVAANGAIEQTAVERTPSTVFVSGSPVISDFVNANADAIVRDAYVVPREFATLPFLGGSSQNNLAAWSAPGILDGEARHHFSINTCNGCHSARETHTEFLHVSPREVGVAAPISAFLKGIAIHDPITGRLRILNELGRRKLDLEQFVCGGVDKVDGPP